MWSLQQLADELNRERLSLAEQQRPSRRQHARRSARLRFRPAIRRLAFSGRTLMRRRKESLPASVADVHPR